MIVPVGQRPFFGRRVVGAAFIMAIFGWGFGFYGPPIFMQAVLERTQWSVGFVSAAVTLHFLFGALVVARLPQLHARFGVPRVTVAGSAALALGVIGWALAREPWQVLLAALISGAGWVTMGAAAVNAVIAPWFVARRPIALATAYNGASIGGVILSPLWAWAIARFGFGVAAVVLGLVMVFVMVVLARSVFAVTPEAIGQHPDGEAMPRGPMRSDDPAAARAGVFLWRDRLFLTLAVGTSLGLFAQAGLIAHLYSVLVTPLGNQGASLAMGLATACAIAGRIVVGRLMPPGTDRRLVSCVCYGVQVAGSLLLLCSAGSHIALLLFGVVLFGSGIGNATSLPPLIAQTEFAKADVQRVVALNVAISQATYALAPAAFGLLRMSLPAGNTGLMFAVAAAIQLAAIGCFFLGRTHSSPVLAQPKTPQGYAR
ncbi:MFS transporter [Methylovirgula sp. 4M-Z18]|uniref:MFS transporter n=1 Tax=Methylovirgula sp. 4M-Z18 TaxID=2293567 RepID=UPI000E2F35B6|nr:MFS transporter [Methylovirgula sp. 4M-Z18]RFB76328.1 MFS transporter [Methylovirgula sp. 4M-Z18]